MSAAVGSIAKWYVSKLKSRPLITNVTSAFVLMTAGDLLAQQLEAKKRCTVSNLSMAVIGEKDSIDDPNILSQEPESSSVLGTSSAMATQDSVTSTSWDMIQKELAFWDPKRTMTMAAWSVCIYTPFYIGLYRLYDRYLPKQTPASIATRVALSFLTSIPVNSAFYTYGAAAHHTIEWLDNRKKLQVELEDLGLDSNSAYQAATSIPYPQEAFWAKALHKLENELPNTVVTSGSCWIPFNLFTFTMVPSHLRPISLMVFSAFWNCYLSLSQHREVGASTSTDAGTS